MTLHRLARTKLRVHRSRYRLALAVCVIAVSTAAQALASAAPASAYIDEFTINGYNLAYNGDSATADPCYTWFSYVFNMVCPSHAAAPQEHNWEIGEAQNESKECGDIEVWATDKQIGYEGRMYSYAGGCQFVTSVYYYLHSRLAWPIGGAVGFYDNCLCWSKLYGAFYG